MAIIPVNESFDPSRFTGTACAFGVFDGLHRGHRELIEATVSDAKDHGLRSLALTFDKDPDEIFHPQRLKKLMNNDQRLEALAESGVDDVVVLPFTPELYELEGLDFLDRLFSKGAPSSLHVGSDFRFGARAASNVKTLERWVEAGHGMEVRSHELVEFAGAPITSTRIRLLLAEGKVREAAELLGHPYAVEGIVRPGRGDGSNFGFATANLQLSTQLRVLGEGVYGGYGIVDGKRYKAAISVGVSPTFKAESTANMEVHLLDFDGDLRDRPIRVEVIEHLRPMIRFDSTEDLIRTVNSNIDWIRHNLP